MARQRSSACTDCKSDGKCDKPCSGEHQQRAPNYEVRKALRLVSLSIEEALETHRWARRMGANREPEAELYCLDCWMTISWNPKKQNEPTVGKIGRCPGRTVVKALLPERMNPFGLKTLGATAAKTVAVGETHVADSHPLAGGPNEASTLLDAE